MSCTPMRFHPVPHATKSEPDTQPCELIANVPATAGENGDKAPCFSPLKSMSPPLFNKNKASPAMTTNPNTIFHIFRSPKKKPPAIHVEGLRFYKA